MIRGAVLFLALAAFAQASTTFAVSLTEGDTLFDNSQFTAGVVYSVVFQLVGGTTSDSTAMVWSIDLGGGTADLSGFAQYRATVGTDGLAEGSLGLSVVPDDGFAYFVQQLQAGTQFRFTVTLSGLYSPPTPDAFTFQLYDQGSNIVYEQTFNVTSPATVPEPGTWVSVLGGVGILGIVRRFRLGASVG